MAQEAKRGCGYRKVHALYLVGRYIPMECDRLPLPLERCPVCGMGMKFTRAPMEINPHRLFGPHDDIGKIAWTTICRDRIRPCHVCDPPDDAAYIMGVGEKYYTPESFAREAVEQGISKRIAAVPKKLVLGKTIIYLSHPKAVEVKEPAVLQQAMAIAGGDEQQRPRLLEAEKAEHKLGIFCAFVPQAVEMLIWESEATPEYLEQLGKRGILPVILKDGDKDHE